MNINNYSMEFLDSEIYVHKYGTINLNKLKTAKYLIFDYDYNKKNINKLPNNITHISFGYNYCQPLCILPENLIYLSLGDKFNMKINRLPTSLVYLTFGNSFNNSLNILETLINLEELIFGSSFNQPIFNLEKLNKLRKLTFGDSFNMPIKKLGENITHLIFGNSFNQKIDHILTNSIECLTLGTKFTNGVIAINDIINKNYLINLETLPKLKKLSTKTNIIKDINFESNSIKKLILTLNFCTQTLNLAGDSLTDLKIMGFVDKKYNSKIIDNLPKKLINLTIDFNFGGSLDKLPDTLRSLTITKTYEQPLDKLPENLQILNIFANYNQPIDKLPKGLTSIIFNNKSYSKNKNKIYLENKDIFNLYFKKIDNTQKDYSFQLNKIDLYPIKKLNGFTKSFSLTPNDKFQISTKINNTKIPIPNSSLSYKTYEGCDFSQSIKSLENLQNLKILVLKNTYHNDNVDNLPDQLRFLIFGYDFNKSVDKLPSKLKYLEFGESFDQPIDKLPESLKYLILGKKFNRSVDNLPKNLKYLILGTNFNGSVDNLPENLTYLKIDNQLQNRFNLLFKHPIDRLPMGLTHLYLCIPYYEYQINNLPNYLEELQLPFWHQKISNLGINLKYIITYTTIKSILPDHLPYGCKTIFL